MIGGGDQPKGEESVSLCDDQGESAAHCTLLGYFLQSLLQDTYPTLMSSSSSNMNVMHPFDNPVIPW